MFSCCTCEHEENEVTIPRQHDEYEPEPYPRGYQMTPERKLKEKERLSKLVRTFAKESAQGVKCMFFDYTSGEKTEAEYTLDKSIKTFGVCVKSRQFSFLMCNLHEVYTWDVMQRTPKLANFLKTKAFASLNSTDTSHITMLEYMDEKQYLQRLCLILPQRQQLMDANTDQEGASVAEDFTNCLKILRLFSLPPPDTYAGQLTTTT